MSSNLVLARPAGWRIHIVSDENEARVRGDAAEFARFLGVPLLDHVMLDQGRG